MEPTPNRYLLHLQYRDIASTDPLAKEGNRLHYQPTIAACLLQLLTIPPDQFDPTTAVLQGHDRYIHFAELFDLSSGKMVLSLFKLKLSDELGGGIFLVLEPGIPMSTIDPSGTLKDRKSLEAPGFVKLLAYHDECQFLHPTRDYGTLVDRLCNALVREEENLVPHHYASIYYGYDLHQASVHQGQLRYKPVADEHYFPNSEQVFAHLLRTSQDLLGKDSAFEKDLPFYFTEVEMMRLYPDKRTLVSSLDLEATGNTDLDNMHPMSGFYLVFSEGLGNLNRLTGTGISDHLLIMTVVDPEALSKKMELRLFKLFERAAVDGTLSPSAESDALRVELCKQPTLQQRFPYQVEVSYRLFAGSKSSTDGAPVPEQRMHIYEPTLAGALFHLAVVPVERISPALVDRAGLEQQLLSARIADNKGQVLVDFHVEPGNEPGIETNVYIRFHPSLAAEWNTRERLLSHASILRTDHLEKDGMLWYQVGKFLPEKFFVHANMIQLRVSAIALQLESQLRERPEIAAPTPPLLKEQDQYLVCITWQHHLPFEHSAGPTMFQHFQGQTDLATAIASMQRFPPVSFNAAAMRGEDLPFHLDSLTLLDIGLNILAERKLDASQQAPTFTVFTHHLPDGLQQTLRQLVGQLPGTQFTNMPWQREGPSSDQGPGRSHRRYLPAAKKGGRGMSG